MGGGCTHHGALLKPCDVRRDVKNVNIVVWGKPEYGSVARHGLLEIPRGETARLGQQAAVSQAAVPTATMQQRRMEQQPRQRERTIHTHGTAYARIPQGITETAGQAGGGDMGEGGVQGVGWRRNS